MGAVVDPRDVLDCTRGCDGSTRQMVHAVEHALAQLLTADGRPGAGSCGGCHAALELPMRATARSITVEPPAAEPYTITFTLPLVRCGGCGSDNVPPGLRAELRSCALEACGLPIGRTRRSRLAALVSRRRRRGAPGSPGHP